MLIASLLSFAIIPVSQQAADAPLDGVSVPLRQDLSSQLADALSYLEQQRWSHAVPLLQELLAAPRSAVFKQSHDLYIGIASFAAAQLQNLPNDGADWYHNNYQQHANEIVTANSKPLNISQLESNVLNFAGLKASTSAKNILSRAYRDRKYYEMYAPLSPQRLPLIDSQNVQAAWQFSFDDFFPLKHNTHRLAFGDGMVYATNGHDVVALDAANGAVRWKFDNQQWHGVNDDFNSKLHAAQSQFTIFQPVLSDGILLVNIHQAQAIGRSDKYRNIDIRHMIPLRRLHAFDAQSGELLWKQESETVQDDELAATNICIGPPTVSAGRAFVPVYDAGGNVDISLMSFDLHSGKQLFKTFLASGSMETNLFGNLLTEPATPAPVSDGKHVWLISQFGTLSCVAARTGIVEWTLTYPRTKVVPLQDGRVSQRIYNFDNNPIFLKNGKLIVAPIDSESLLAVEAFTGKVFAAFPAQGKRDNRMRNLIDFDGEVLTTSGSRVQRVYLFNQQPAITSPLLYRFNGYNNENLISAQLSKELAWMPNETGLAVAPSSDLNDIKLILEWTDSSLLSRSPIQLNDGSIYFLTRFGVSSYSSDSYQLIAAQPSESLHRRDLNYFAQIDGRDLSQVNTTYATVNSALPYLNARDRELAKLVMARCDLFSSNFLRANDLLHDLQFSFDDEIAWQAAVLLSESQNRPTPQLLNYPHRSALLLDRHSVPSAALIAYIASDWLDLINLYLKKPSAILERWLTNLLHGEHSKMQLKQWLGDQLNRDDLNIERAAMLYSLAYKFTDIEFSEHTSLLKPTADLLTYDDSELGAGESLPWSHSLLHAFAGESKNLLFYSQRTLILVKDGVTHNITPFDSSVSIRRLEDKCVSLPGGCAIFAAGVCVFFDNDGNYHVNKLDIDLSLFNSPIAIGNFVLHTTYLDRGMGLAFIEPSTGTILWQRQLEKERSFRNEIWVSDTSAIYATENSETILLIDLAHQQSIDSIGEQQAIEMLNSSAELELELEITSGASADGKLIINLGSSDAEPTAIAFDDIDFRLYDQHSSTLASTTSGHVIAFATEDPLSGKPQLNVALLDGDFSIISKQRMAFHPLNRSKFTIHLLDNQVIVGVSRNYYRFPIK
ncbi:MAG: PQQ-binding-like beta-propeller repeat protein [Planctomycetes bacterium]|nr:PQQ-binding-like beta-propeller repeat protein [Planctomycetota bacterium]